MSSSKEIIIAFDLYGTLLSTESISKRLAEHFGPEQGATLAANWRKYQLEYTWRLNSMGQYIPFSEVTHGALLNTLAEASLTLSAAQVDGLMSAYDALSTFPDVPAGLEAIRGAAGVTAVVFSNGTSSMVANSVNRSPDLAPHAATFRELVVVEATRRFKPDPEVYRHLARRCGKDDASMGDMWLVSGNPFDCVGAVATGMKAMWVDRAGNGWADALVAGDKGRPTATIAGLGEVVDVARKFADR